MTISTVARRADGWLCHLELLLDTADLEKERGRLEKLCAQKTKQIAGFEGRLSNESYVQKAKPELVAETRRMLEEARADLEAAQAALERMG